MSDDIAALGAALKASGVSGMAVDVTGEGVRQPDPSLIAPEKKAELDRIMRLADAKAYGETLQQFDAARTSVEKDLAPQITAYEKHYVDSHYSSDKPNPSELKHVTQEGLALREQIETRLKGHTELNSVQQKIVEGYIAGDIERKATIIHDSPFDLPSPNTTSKSGSKEAFLSK